MMRDNSVILNQCVVAVVMLSFDLWFGGHKSSREFIWWSQALGLGFPLLEEIQKRFKKGPFSREDVEGMEGTQRQVGSMY